MRPMLLGAAMIGAASVLTATEAMAQCSRTSIPLPDLALLVPSPAVSCEFKTASRNDATGQPQAGQPQAAAARDPAAEAAALDYERQCYRQVATILRDRLRQLQASVGETVKAVNRACPAAVSSRPGAKGFIPLPRRALLTPPPDFDCTFKGNPADGSAPSPTPAQAAAALRAKLDYDRQCYRHNGIILRNGLEQLQAAVGETIKALDSDERSAARGKPAGRQQPAAMVQPATTGQPAATQEPAATAQPAAMAQQPNGRRQSRAKEAPCAALSSHGRCIGRDPDARVRFMLSHDNGSE